MITREMRFKKDFILEKIEDVKLKELRIGNFVYCLSDDEKTLEFVEISEIHEDMVYFTQCNFDGTIGGLCYPIPLTEEWLLKMDFVNFGKRWTHSKLSLDIIQGVGFYMQYVRLEINYVHTLQNLYFAITGEELNVNN